MRSVFFLTVLWPVLFAGAQDATKKQTGNVAIIKNYMKSEKKAGLDKEELSELETILAKCIADNNKTEPKESIGYLNSLLKYNRQYLPYYENGEKKVVVNCFCDDVKRFPKWKKEMVTVFDGGSCYFMVAINLTKKEYSDLHINGAG